MYRTQLSGHVYFVKENHFVRENHSVGENLSVEENHSVSSFINMIPK